MRHEIIVRQHTGHALLDDARENNSVSEEAIASNKLRSRMNWTCAGGEARRRQNPDLSSYVLAVETEAVG